MKHTKTQFALIAIAVLVLALFAGCAGTRTEGDSSLDGENQETVTQEDVAAQAEAQIDANLIEDTDDVEIGEMI